MKKFEYNFSCSCGHQAHVQDIEADNVIHAKSKVEVVLRKLGWIIDDDYPGIACSVDCYMKSKLEWERNRSLRHLVHAELTKKN